MFKKIILLAIGAFAALPALAQDTIKIGLVTALSGQSARAGEAITRGLQIAIDELNASAGSCIKRLPVKRISSPGAQ